jgi:surface protein
MFCGMSNLTSLDLSHFDTSNVTNMKSMFSGMSNLVSLDLSSFDTSNVPNMSYMFYNLESLTSLDISSFNTSHVTNMESMFGKMSNLEIIYVSNEWDVSKVRTSYSMFYLNNKLRGGAGTTYNSSYGIEYARVDDPDNGKPGYFTLKTN